MERSSEQRGAGREALPGRTMLRVMTIAMWAMLIAGAMLQGPSRFGLWAAACTVGGVRNVWMARQVRSGAYWVMAAVFFAAAVFVVIEGFALGPSLLP